MKEYFKQFEAEWVDKMTKAIASKPYSECEKGVADIALATLEEIGAECCRDKVGNVVGVIRGSEPGPTIVLNGHMDVVPEGSLEAWGDLDPFKAEVRDGKLYGRGTTDMLSGFMCELFAFREVKKAVDAGAALKGNLVIAGVVCEETAESLGTLTLCEETLPAMNIKPDFVILGEQSNGNLNVGQRGKVELVVEVYGKVAHSSAPWQGISAVEKAMPVVEAINNQLYKVQPVHEKLGPAVMCVTDIEVTPGRMYSCVPDHCSITIDRRYLPDSYPGTIQECIDEFQAFLDFLAKKDPEFKAEVHQRMNKRKSYLGDVYEIPKQHAAWITDMELPMVKASFAALRKIGLDPQEAYFVVGTDGSITAGTYNIPTISFAMTLPEMCHQPREYCVLADEMVEIEGFTVMAFDLLGLDFDATYPD
ncbi:MAG: M20/M25/M40 family metallo-hydrolase [Lachnospiraceae bacterium]|nr:M20/M25/M40 family metallo-hydrolase [Lachnospiraceae bacterium]